MSVQYRNRQSGSAPKELNRREEVKYHEYISPVYISNACLANAKDSSENQNQVVSNSISNMSIDWQFEQRKVLAKRDLWACNASGMANQSDVSCSIINERMQSMQGSRRLRFNSNRSIASQGNVRNRLDIYVRER